MLTPGDRAEQLVKSGIEVESLHMRRGVPNPGAILKLAVILRKWNPHVLHCHMVHANLLGRIVRIFTSVPVVISTAHNIDEGGRWREVAYRLTDFLADATTNVSQAAVDRYLEVGVAPRNKIRFIPNGINTDEFKPDDQARNLLRDELGVEDAFLWLAVGRFEEAKDYPNMFRAFSKLKESRNAKLFIVGQGELEGDFKQQVKELHIENRVHFLGLRQDIPKIMNIADGYVMSSAWEGLPMVLLEAASTSIPIVATDVGGNREILINDVSGFIVPPNDSDQLASSLLRLMVMAENERVDMGKAGRDYVEKHFGLENVVDMWERLYWEFLELKGKVK